MQSSFLSVDKREVLNSVLIAAVSAVLVCAQQMLTKYGFHLSQYDWALVLQVGVSAGLGVLATNLGTTKSGKFLGAVKIK